MAMPSSSANEASLPDGPNPVPNASLPLKLTHPEPTSLEFHTRDTHPPVHDSTNGTNYGEGKGIAQLNGQDTHPSASSEPMENGAAVPSRPVDAHQGGNLVGQSDTVSRPPSPRPASSRQRRVGHQREPSSVAGNVSPSQRRSVQFARGASDNEGQGISHSRASSFGFVDGDKVRRNHHSLFSKLRAFTGSSGPPTHSRTTSGVTIGPEFTDGRLNPDHPTPGSERGEFRFPWTHGNESEADADAESSSGEQRVGLRKKMKRKMKRPKPESEPHTAPPTPGVTGHHEMTLPPSDTNPADDYVPSRFRRRPIASTLALHGGMSEDEGRERLNREGIWGRIQNARAFSHAGQARQDGLSGPEDNRRPGHLRRLTGLGGASDYGESLTAAWRKHKAERGTSISAQRWRQIKAGLKMIGQRRKAETTVDHVKSAELLAELSSGIPAVLMLASMFQRDEHGSKRIPILLEQLKVHVTDSEIDPNSSDRHLVFRIELEYGSGITRMKWVIHRSLRDFANLHLKYKMHIGAKKYIQLKGDESGNTLPHFPRGAFPYLRGVRGLESEEEEEDDGGDETAGEATSGNERSNRKKKRKSRRSIGGISRQASSLAPEEGGSVVGTDAGHGDGQPGPSSNVGKREPYRERQRKKLEIYLQKMIRFLIFRPDSNRLCKFLELSTLGVRLAAEGTYHGKEGFLVIQSSKGLDFRKALKPSLVRSRHSPKWFLVRHSYIVCVDSPEDMHIYDVFMVDPFFQLQSQKVRLRDQNAKEIAKTAKESAAHPKHHTLKIQNSERKMRLLARNERQLHQFEESIRFMIDHTPWAKPNRFGSFAPPRQKCFAQWLVDGRDYMWVVSRAINQAKDVIYIHDWWLSPELYMRRPPAISQKWRLDRLLQRKAQQGVKIFVIMYRNINTAIPIDSEYTKFSLLDLHPNVFVQRSPNQFRQNTLFWAHHEKLCLIDHTIAFIGGIDLCFGRWDTPQHLLTDDKITGFEPSDLPMDADHCQLWPGKDYSNPRVQDFYDLNQPYEEMYDRNVVPRMPWHDISMHVVGQPARDLTRHFVQRWNYILRQRKPTRPTPFLLPPPDFNPADLEALGLDGTCEVQVLRSCGMWSMGMPDHTEHSIMNAYVKMIEMSDHFVYIENQFFITSCEIDGKKIENNIGDALVERIIRAARNDEDWRAVILLPLMPGFQNTVDTEGGTSVRLIMQAQYRSICRGESSIFGRLRAQGIEPEDYIQFFSLRSWGKIGPRKHLVTEQLYIHAKCMVVDDRVAIIGSANINERSMLGSRDSECAAIVRDTDMIWSSMNGKPYLVGRFPHTLRMRLMREHIGIDVDEVLEQELEAEADARIKEFAPKGESTNGDCQAEPMSLASDKPEEGDLHEQRQRLQDEFLARSEHIPSFNHDVDWEQADNPNLKTNKKLTADSRVTRNQGHRKDLDGDGVDQMKKWTEAGGGDGRDSYLSPTNAEILVSNNYQNASLEESNGRPITAEKSSVAPSRLDGDRLPSSGKASATAASPKSQKTFQNRCTLPHLVVDEDPLNQHKGDFSGSHPLASEIVQPSIDKDCMKDPLADSFYLDTWQAIAENNTKLFRAVFRCMPDSEVRSWKEYKEYDAYAERFADMQNSYYYDANAPHLVAHPSSRPQSGPVGAGTVPVADKLGGPVEKVSNEIRDKVTNHVSREAQDENALKRWASEANKAQLERQLADIDGEVSPSAQDEKAALKAPETKSLNSPHAQSPNSAFPSIELEKSQQSNGLSVEVPSLATSPSIRRRRRAATRGSKREFHASDDIMSMPEAEELLNMVQGHLILWPYEWLEREEQGGNWLYTLDQISPLEIYI